MEKNREFIISMYNASSTNDGKGGIKTYETWLEKQLLKKLTHKLNMPM